MVEQNRRQEGQPADHQRSEERDPGRDQRRHQCQRVALTLGPPLHGHRTIAIQATNSTTTPSGADSASITRRPAFRRSHGNPQAATSNPAGTKYPTFSTTRAVEMLASNPCAFSLLHESQAIAENPNTPSPKNPATTVTKLETNGPTQARESRSSPTGNNMSSMSTSHPDPPQPA
ncbi:hypothetical protein GZL_04460 [Streptomyces sp. 769]|nr:hypothetical protein GZL_04460 [Streptomyces sp. 769]